MTMKSLTLPLALLASAAAHAGVVVESVERDAKTGKIGDGTRMYIQGSVARFDQSLNASQGEYVIFRDDTLFIVEPAQRSYTAMDRKTVSAMANQMGAAMQQMRAQLANLPPEQRKMMEQMMGGNMPGAKAPPAPLVARDLGRSEKVDGRNCRLWELTRGKVIDSQVCVVPFNSLPGKEDVLGLMQRMSEMMQPLAEALEGLGSISTDTEAMASVKGFPVLWRDYDGGKPSGKETLMRSWREESVDAALLQVPKGYRKRDPLAEMGR